MKDIGEMCSSRRILQSDWRDSGIPFYRAREIVKLSIYGYVNNELFIDYDKYNELKNNSPLTIPKADDIMISAVGTIGKSYIVQENDKFYYKDASVLCFKNFGFISVKFLKLMLDSPFIQKQMIENSNGTTVDTITIDSSKYYIICIPPLSEQQRIVDIIEQLFAQVDKIEEEKLELLKLIDKAKEKVLDLAMKGKLVKQDPNDEPANVLLEKIFEEKKKLAKEGKIKLSKDDLLAPQISDDNDYYQDLPKNWYITKLKDIGIWGAGSTPNRKVPSYYNGDIPWLKTGELNNNIIFGCEEKITEKALNECNLKLNKIGNVLIAMYGATIGKLGIAGIELTTNQACCGCQPFIFNKYLFYYLMSIKNNLIMQGSGGAQPNISKDIIINNFILVPPYNEQKRIVETIENLLDKMNQIKDSL